VVHALQCEELPYVVLRVALLQLLKILQSELGELTWAKNIGGRNHRGDNHRLFCIGDWAMDILNCAVSSTGVAWIAGNEDLAAVLWRDRKSMLFLESCQLTLLLSPFGTSLPFSTYVRLG
jgi:hypothetical protein